MNGIFNKFFFIAFIFCTCQILLINGVAIREKRNSLERGRTDGEDQNSMNPILSFQGTTTHQSCVSVLKECKRQSDCRETLKDLKTKCAIKSRSCNAGIHDLQACATIMDDIGEFIDIDNKCTCHHQNKERCSKTYDTIYENPCFASVKLLRQKNLMPRTEKNLGTQLGTQKSYESISSNDVIEELIESIVSENDDVTTAHSKITSLADLQENSQEINLSDTDVETSKAPIEEPQLQSDLGENVEAKPSQQDRKNSSNNSLLLYIIVGVVGILVIVLVVVGLSLLLYFGLWRKGRNATKTSK